MKVFAYFTVASALYTSLQGFQENGKVIITIRLVLLIQGSLNPTEHSNNITQVSDNLINSTDTGKMKIVKLLS